MKKRKKISFHQHFFYIYIMKSTYRDKVIRRNKQLLINSLLFIDPRIIMSLVPSFSNLKMKEQYM